MEEDVVVFGSHVLFASVVCVTVRALKGCVPIRVDVFVCHSDYEGGEAVWRSG